MLSEIFRKRGLGEQQTRPSLMTEQDLGKVGQVGFQKWYEQQLKDSHIWLVAAFASLILLTIGFELFSARELIVTLLVKAVMIASGVLIAWVAFKKYSRSILLARSVGEIAICPPCGYPSFSVVRREIPGVNNMPTRITHDLNQDGLLVSCRRCHHKWRWGYHDQQRASPMTNFTGEAFEA
jgi:hypothetical protein